MQCHALSKSETNAICDYLKLMSKNHKIRCRFDKWLDTLTLSNLKKWRGLLNVVGRTGLEPVTP